MNAQREHEEVQVFLNLVKKLKYPEVKMSFWYIAPVITFIGLALLTSWAYS